MSTLLPNASTFSPWIEEIVDHESDERRSELDRYNKALLLQNLKEAIDLPDYEADISHLRRTTRQAV